MFGILAFAIATAIAYFAAPSMPLYSAKDIELKRFRFSFTEWTVSLEILAGVEIDNGNIVGGDLYSTLVDIYYPDWHGDLQNIGYLKETTRSQSSDVEDDVCSKMIGETDDHGICIPSKRNGNVQPFFSVQSRGISTTEPGAITIYLNHVPPKTYLNILKHIFTQWGSIHLLVSGVAHVKSPLGLPLSLGVICDNVLDLTRFPLQVVGKECLVERISTGWSGLEELAAEVRDRVLGYYVEMNGSIFGVPPTPLETTTKSRPSSTKSEQQQQLQRQQLPEPQEPKSALDQFFSSSEVILDWHDF